jgi:DNA recombination-mediator protein A
MLADMLTGENQPQHTISVPFPASVTEDPDIPDPNDQLAAELMALRNPAKAVAIIGSRNIPLPHQNLIEAIAYTLAKEGNTIVTSGGSSGTNAASIRGALRANADKLKVILPQTLTQQPSDVQDQLIGVNHLHEHPEWQMMTLADASRLCNREIVDACQQLIIFLNHDSHTLQTALEYAEENHKIVTRFYLD